MTTHQSNYKQLLEEAEVWIIRLRSDSVSSEDHLQFSKWLNTSQEHSRAFDEVYSVWQHLGAVEFLQYDDAEQTSPGFWHHIQQCLPQANSAALCLGIATIALITITLIFQPKQNIPTRYHHYESTVGQSLSVNLKDGSQIELNTNSAIDVHYSKDKRSITLLKGEAYFNVAKDKQRPFVVDFGKGSATAVGTAFNIHKQDGLSAVTVTEGIVAVREPADIATPYPLATRVYANQQVYLSQRGLSPVKQVSTQKHTAWRDKTIVFKNTPLKHALKELNRYLETPVDIAASELDDLHVSGTFSLESPTLTLKALSKAFALKQQLSDNASTVFLLKRKL